ncbi:metabotropic glutamate receptor-like [Amphiura filiformis]|uniref:metabotropic glutamate receptor-like n=1 Tax=Amphiura filiformis TaxID=82378 RepID=UPI003B213239
MILLLSQMWLHLIFISTLLLRLVGYSTCWLPNLPQDACINYYQPGDFLLGGIFPIGYTDETAICTGHLSWWGISTTEAMVYAIEQINQRTDLLPNVTLGFDIRDGCRNEDVCLFHASSLASFKGPEEYRTICSYHPSPKGSQQVVAIIGTGRSATSVFAAKISNIYSIPLISHWASSDELSDKNRFPYFLRTLPADKAQIGSIIDILYRFHWLYVGVLYSLDAGGLLSSQYFKTSAEPEICIAYSQPVGATATANELDDIVATISEFNKASVIVMFTSNEISNALMMRFDASQLPSNITFICTTYCGYGWVTGGLGARSRGSLYLRYYTNDDFEYHNYMQSLQNVTELKNPWVRKLYSRIGRVPDTIAGASVHNVIKAVFAFAHGLHSYIEVECSSNKSCEINQQNLFYHIWNVSFPSVDGQFEFDDEGNAPLSYTIYNVQKRGHEYVQESIGSWDPKDQRSQRLTLNEGNFQFAGNGHRPSLCKDICPVGSIEVPLKMKCCWGCRSCRPEEIVVDNSKCVPCRSTEWPNEARNQCVPISPSSVDWKEATVVVVLFFNSLGLFLTSLVTVGFYFLRQHPLIKATSRELSAVNIGGLFTTFIAVFTFLIWPTTASCIVSEAILTLAFTLNFSPTLLKVIRIYRIFKAGRKSVKRPVWIGPKHQTIMCSVLIAIQIAISIVSSVVNSARPALIIPTPPQPRLELYCKFSPVFLASCVYNLLIITACCVFAFLARKVPSNYNESKFIAITVYSTLVVCLAALPVYSTAIIVLQKKATLCITLLINAYITLIFLYTPKLYAIMFVLEGLKIEDQSRRRGNTAEFAKTLGQMSKDGTHSARVHPMTH